MARRSRRPTSARRPCRCRPRPPGARSALGSGSRPENPSANCRRSAADVLLPKSRGPQTLAETLAELGQRARAATPEEAARAGGRVAVSIPPAPYRELSRRRTVGQGRARHRSVRDAPYDEPDDGRVGLVEPRHVVGDHQQHALGGPGQRTTCRLSGRRRCPGRNGMSRKTGGCMRGSHPARPLPPRPACRSPPGPFPVRAVFASQLGPHAIRTASAPRTTRCRPPVAARAGRPRRMRSSSPTRHA